MKKLFLFVLLLALLLSGCGQKTELEAWEMPTLDAAPTTEPTSLPAASSAQAAERYVWNEGTGFRMSDPGVSVPASQAELTHAETLALFGGQFLPKTIFNESYGSYERMYLEQTKHDVLLDGSGALPENAYVEYRYLNKAWVEAGSISVMAELCSYERALEIFSGRAYPHIGYPEDAKPQLSTYSLQNFVLTKIGDTRYAQWLAVPSQYFYYAEKMEKLAAAQDIEPDIPRIPLLTFTCREQVTDEQFIAAVRTLGQFCSSSIVLTDPDAPVLPKPGEKGAA